MLSDRLKEPLNSVVMSSYFLVDPGTYHEKFEKHDIDRGNIKHPVVMIFFANQKKYKIIFGIK